jgi:DNA polymerase-3 subunit delta'
LQKAIVDDRVAGAYCLPGKKGIGKEALAIEFAKTVNCEDPIIEGDRIEACGRCKSCGQMDELSHPNFSMIFSLPAGKGSDTKSDSPYAKLTEAQIGEIQEQIAIKAENPYHDISVPNANQIKIASVRDIKKKLSLSGSRQGRRCVLICNAEEMTSEAANAFLKTLEEPHPGITILMVTSRPDMLLPTIMSRCQQLRCDPLKDDEIAEALAQRHDIEPAEAGLVARYARGSYTTALEFLSEDMRRLRVDMIDMLRVSMKKRRFRVELLEMIDELIKTSDKSRLETALNILLFWLRDANLISSAGKDIYLVNPDQEETLRKFTGVFSGANIGKAIEKVESSIADIRRNINSQLILTGLFLDMREIFIEKRD